MALWFQECCVWLPGCCHVGARVLWVVARAWICGFKGFVCGCQRVAMCLLGKGFSFDSTNIHV